MCSNRAIADTLECYMDDLVECFEDFVKKSLIVISFGIGAIIAVLLYLLKMMCDRQPFPNMMSESLATHRNEMQNLIEESNLNCQQEYCNQAIPKSIAKEKELSTVNKNDKKPISASVNTSPQPLPMPSYDEQILRDLGLSSCSKTFCRSRINSLQNKAFSKVPIPKSSPPKHKSIHSIRPSKHNMTDYSALIYPTQSEKQGSCCSMDCDDTPSATKP